MEVILKKSFRTTMSIDEMENWLNEQGQKGLRLSRVSNNRYIFEQADKIVYYRMAFINSKLSYADQQAFINGVTLTNLLYICRAFN